MGVSGLQANPIFGYSFYSFFYSLQFHRKWYQRYQLDLQAAMWGWRVSQARKMRS